MYTINFLHFSPKFPKILDSTEAELPSPCQQSVALLFFSCSSLSGNLRLNIIILAVLMISAHVYH